MEFVTINVFAEHPRLARALLKGTANGPQRAATERPMNGTAGITPTSSAPGSIRMHGSLDGEWVEGAGECFVADARHVSRLVEDAWVQREVDSQVDEVELGVWCVRGGLASIPSVRGPKGRTIQEVIRRRATSTVDLRSSGSHGGGNRLLLLVERDGGRSFLASPVS